MGGVGSWAGGEKRRGPTYLEVCWRSKFSSANLLPKMDSPPVPSPFVKSPPWAIKPRRWKKVDE